MAVLDLNDQSFPSVRKGSYLVYPNQGRNIMATADCLEANPTQKIQVEGETEVGEKTNVIDENLTCRLNKPKKVHQIYFVKLWPFKDPEEASKIAEAEKLVEKLDQELTRINDKRRVLNPIWRYKWQQIGHLGNRSYRISDGIYLADRLLDHLQIALDKVNIANPPKGRSCSKSALPTEQNTNHVFKRKMLHGGSNLATERHLLKEIDRGQKRLDYFISPRPLLEEYGLLNQLWWYNNGVIDKTKYRQMVEKIRHIEEGNEKALGDAIAKGEPWDPLSTKRAIEEQIKLVKKIRVELKRAKNEDISKREQLTKDIESIREELHGLRFQGDISWEKDAAQRSILRVRQQFDEMNGRYKEYLSLLSNARELARKKDVAALRTLSQAQVEEFMSEWNEKYVRTFRVNYEISVSQSLENRQLSRDGRIESFDEETAAYIVGLQH